MFSFYFARNFNNLACSLVHGYSSSKHSTTRQLPTFCAHKDFTGPLVALTPLARFMVHFACARVFLPPPSSCCAVLIVVQQDAKVPPNKNPTMSLFLISQSFGPYNVVFISGGSVEEGFCLRLFCINPTDNARRNLFHFETQLNVFR